MRVLVASALAALAVAFPPGDAVPSLPGWASPLPSKWYSGYLNVPGGKHAHYVFIERTTSPAVAPISVWLNGGM